MKERDVGFEREISFSSHKILIILLYMSGGTSLLKRKNTYTWLYVFSFEKKKMLLEIWYSTFFTLWVL